MVFIKFLNSWRCSRWAGERGGAPALEDCMRMLKLRQSTGRDSTKVRYERGSAYHDRKEMPLTGINPGGHMGHIEGHFRNLFSVQFSRRSFSEIRVHLPGVPGKYVPALPAHCQHFPGSFLCTIFS